MELCLGWLCSGWKTFFRLLYTDELDLVWGWLELEVGSRHFELSGFNAIVIIGRGRVCPGRASEFAGSYLARICVLSSIPGDPRSVRGPHRFAA